MIEIRKKTECCGCAACYNDCPKNVIEMIADEEGFLYPSVLLDKCINCGLCEKICPVLHNEVKEESTGSYIVRYKDEKIVDESTSGGAFSAFAIPLLKQGWVVYGVGYDANMRVICKKAELLEGLKEMRGFKFVQSYIGITYTEIKKELQSGTKVLFTRTPCQISGLLNYLEKASGNILKNNRENLICIDFVCRGVPSPGLWKNYVEMMENKFASKMVGAKFKHKTYGYHTSTMKVDFANGKTYYGSGRVDPYMKAFVKEMSSRPSCSACVFKGIERRSDITIFDCCEYSKVTGRIDDNKGYSSNFLHSDAGKNLIKQCSKSLTTIQVPIENLVTENGIMVRHSARPHDRREEFYRYASELPIDQVMDKVSPITRKDYMVEKSKKFLFATGLIRLK